MISYLTDCLENTNSYIYSSHNDLKDYEKLTASHRILTAFAKWTMFWHVILIMYLYFLFQ